METSGLDRLLSYASDLGGVRTGRDREGAARPNANRAITPSRSLESDGVKLSISGLSLGEKAAAPASSSTAEAGALDSDESQSIAPDRRPEPIQVAAEQPTSAPARSGNVSATPRSRAAFSAYERVLASSLGDRVRIKA